MAMMIRTHRLLQTCFARRGATTRLRWFSSSLATQAKIHIHFGTSTGTSQLFAREMESALEMADHEVSVESMEQTKNVKALDPEALHLFLVSTAGVGEPPGPARAFFESLDTPTDASHVRFGVFGLGNSAAHPNHYNVAGQTLHRQLVERQAKPWLPLALGDDGDCIEEDYDQWQEAVLKKLKTDGDAVTEDQSSDNKADSDNTIVTIEKQKETLDVSTISESKSPPVPSPAFGKRLQLVAFAASSDEMTRTDLADISPGYYHPDAQRWKVLQHKSLSPQPTANGLHELQLALDTPHKALSYDAGDHLVVYPCQTDSLVEAYLNHWNISISTALHSTVQMTPETAKLCEVSASSYPHPMGISLYDTLRYCVDLQAPPSPRLARTLLGRQDIDYKEQVFTPRLSPLALLKQSGVTNVSLEDLLYQLPSIAPRYYSIASSSSVHPNSLYLTYRPVRFFNSCGSPQQGLCTSYLQQLQKGSTFMAYVNRNPTFRLPADNKAPVILVAGGCGVGAVRALVEEWSAIRQSATAAPLYIFVGFRTPSDAAYLDVFEDVQPAVLDVAYSVATFPTAGDGDDATSSSCANVSDRIRHHGALLYDLLTRQGAHVYACGGARTFGAALQRELYGIYETHGQCSPTEAQAALQALVEEGRYNEDLAD